MSASGTSPAITPSDRAHGTRLWLQFRMGADSYLLDTADIVEVLPLVQLKRIPQAPRAVAGVFDFRGTPVPVIDMSELAIGKAAARSLSTRLVVVRYADDSNRVRLLGLIAEKATGMVRRAPEEFCAAGVSSDKTPYLGALASQAGRLLQCVQIRKLLPPAVSEVLFRRMEEKA